MVTTDSTQRNGMKLVQGRFKLNTRKKFFHPEDYWAPEHAPQGSAHSTKLDSVQGTFVLSGTGSDSLGCHVQGQELDLIIRICSFQHSIFYDFFPKLSRNNFLLLN